MAYDSTARSRKGSLTHRAKTMNRQKLRKRTEPAFIEPMQCKPVSALPADEKWTFEIKFDGYRCIAVKHGREVTLFSRHQKVLNKRFPKVVEAARLARRRLRSRWGTGRLGSARETFISAQAPHEPGAGVRHWRLHPGAHGFDALLVGVYENKRLIFVAKVKDGFVPRIRDEIFPALQKLRVVHCPFKNLAREKGLAVGRVANRRENGAMLLGQTEAGLPGGIPRMDGCRTPEALHLRCHAR